MEYNYGVHSSTIRSKDGSDKSIRPIHEPQKEEGRKDKRLLGDARRNSLGPVQLGMEDDIMNLIGVQDRSGSADMQNVFGMISYLTGWSPILR